MSIERTDLANIEYRAKTGEFLVDRCACGRRMQSGFPDKNSGQSDRCYSCEELAGNGRQA